MYSEIQRERADIGGLMARPEYREWNPELIKPKKLLNPVKASRSHQELHRELLMNHRRGLGVDSKPELQRVLEHRRRNQIIKKKKEELEAKRLQCPFEQELLRRQQRLSQLEKPPEKEEDHAPEFIKVRENLRRIATLSRVLPGGGQSRRQKPQKQEGPQVPLKPRWTPLSAPQGPVPTPLRSSHPGSPWSSRLCSLGELCPGMGSEMLFCRNFWKADALLTRDRHSYRLLPALTGDVMPGATAALSRKEEKAKSISKTLTFSSLDQANACSLPPAEPL
uniref:Actin-associated protein FAM107A n=1 Tax=Pipistrellus kuhlii TaxID=59472 RepID=A0A7J7WCH5_PIPKU|nr:family with sequence similarity 107 member A [Pipistrellus kuhlii]